MGAGSGHRASGIADVEQKRGAKRLEVTASAHRLGREGWRLRRLGPSFGVWWLLVCGMVGGVRGLHDGMFFHFLVTLEIPRTGGGAGWLAALG